MAQSSLLIAYSLHFQFIQRRSRVILLSCVMSTGSLCPPWHQAQSPASAESKQGLDSPEPLIPPKSRRLGRAAAQAIWPLSLEACTENE